MQIHFYEQDLPDDIKIAGSVAVDTETMGLELQRDRLCLVQLSDALGNCYIVRFKKDIYHAPNLKALFEDSSVLKIFHFGRFDIAAIYQYLGALCTPVYCTKIASKIARTNAPSHSLKALCVNLLGLELEKEQQCSDWGALELNDAQLKYAANDVIHLHALKEKLDALLERENRFSYAQHCFDFLPFVGKLDMNGFLCEDVFTH